ncbi:hypothetical protein MRS44_016960 [Fusarium solani]|uniref:uncharacterized protein n=1 Tax=Fusarium solani TaxID=169388 RepID=UPI0032C464CF|nr:hypothetical protein MRS44_016960 [Fusarium solani]
MSDIGLMIFDPPGGNWGTWTATHGPCLVDIVMVHGLNGGRLSTWTKNIICWPRDLLYHHIPRARVMTFGYDASVIFSSDTSKIRDYSCQLLAQLRDKREAEQLHKEIHRVLIFICHSLGGIVVKQALIIASIADEYRSISESTSGIVFFGTPHRGSSSATIGKLLSRVARFAGTRHYLMRSLEINEDGLQEIAENFTRIVPKYRIKSFYESDRLFGLKLIVPKYSATMGVSQEEPISMKGDHRKICRFSRDDPRFEAVWKAVQRLIPPQNTARPAVTRPSALFPAHANFQRWLVSEDAHVLHIVGEPGSGKSTAADWLFRNSSTWCPGRRCLIFSFQLGYETANASTAWGSLLFQLLEGDTSQSRWESESPRLIQALTYDNLGSFFESASSNSQEIYIIDGLDECDETVHEFLRSLGTVLENSRQSRPKFMLFSRHILLSQIDGLFKPHGTVLRIDMNAESIHVENVKKYIRNKVDKLCIRRDGLDELRDKIVKELDMRSSGVYLLASLTLESLTKSEATPAEVRRILGSLPDDLRSIYSDALEKVGPADQEKVAILLLWVVFAVRPLSDAELSAAIQFCRRTGSFATLEALDDQISRSILGTGGISELVGPIIKQSADKIVSIVHSSAREFIIGLAPDQSQNSSFPNSAWVWNSVGSFDGVESEKLSTRAARALSLHCQNLISFADSTGFLLSLVEPATDTVSFSRPRALLRYAVEHLPDHIRQCSPNQDAHATFAAFLRSPTGRTWMGVFWVLRDPSQQYREFSPLQFCCALGLVEAVKQLLPKGGYPSERLPDVQAVKSTQALASELLTAVDIAAMYGNVDVLETLCRDHRVPVDSDDLIPLTTYKRGGSVFGRTNWIHVEVWSPRNPAPGTKGEDVVRERAKAEEQLTRRYRPLHTATRYGHADAVEYLISRGANLLREDNVGKCAIEVAIDNEVEVAISLLLRHHEHALPKLLLRFIRRRQDRYLARILKLRPDLLVDGMQFRSHLGRYSGSVMHLTAAAGSENMFDALVDLGGQPDVKDSGGRQAIHYAVSAGRDAFVKYLLGQDPAARKLVDNFGRNPLHYAVLGANCAAPSWTLIGSRERTITTLIGQVSMDVSKLLVSSAIISLADSSDLSVVFPLTEDDVKKNDWVDDEPDGGDLDNDGFLKDVFPSAIKLILKDSPVQVGTCFLHKAFTSAYFPLHIALELSSNASETDDQGRTPLHAAATSRRVWDENHRALATRLRDINCRDTQGMTPLRRVVESSEIANADLINRFGLLVSLGADVNSADSSGETPITATAKYLLTAPHISHSSSDENVFPDGALTILLFNKGASTEAINDDILPHLVTALVKTRRTQDAANLLRALSPRQKQELLERGMSKVPGTAELVLMTHEMGWSVDDLSHMIPHLDLQDLNDLFAQTLLRKIQPIAELCLPLIQGNDWLDRPGARDYLVKAAQTGDKNTLDFFLDTMKGSVDVSDSRGQTILSHAAEKGRTEMTQSLLSRGASASIPDNEGRTAVYWAAREGKMEVIKALVEVKAPIKPMDVMVAKERGRNEVAKNLAWHLQARNENGPAGTL